MNTTRRDFFANSVAGMALLLTGALPQEYVPGCYPLKPFNQHVPLNKTYVVLDNGSKYEKVCVDTDKNHVWFRTTIEDNDVVHSFTCGIKGKDLSRIYNFDQDTSDSDHKYILVNNKGEYGLLCSTNKCWDFRRCDES